MRIHKAHNQNTTYLLIISFLLICPLLSSCLLDRSGLAPPSPPRAGTPIGTTGVPGSWGASAFPGFACVADNISLEWNVGDPMCPTGTGPSCQTLTISDSLGLLNPPFTSRDQTGTHINGNVASLGSSWSGANPVFTFAVTSDIAGDPGWTDITSEIQMIQNPPAPPLAQQFAATSVCNPASRRWSLVDFRLDMSSPAFIDSTRGLGPCVRITSVCYMPGSGSVGYDPIIVSLIGGAMPSVTLSRGECIDGINLPPDLHYQVVPDSSVPIIERMGGACVEGTTADPITPAPYIELQFTLRCDTELPACGN